MKNTFLIFLISSISFLSANAQRTDLVYSNEKFPEKLGKYKLKILKNGNTANIGLTEAAGFFCTLYDVNKKAIAHTVIPTQQESIYYILRTVLEINNDIVVMLAIYDEATPKLIRYILDGSTGKLKKEEVILTMPIMDAKIAASQYDHTGYEDGEYRSSGLPEAPDFYIQKDQSSDYYAVVFHDVFSEDMNKRIEVVHYSPTHEILNRAYLLNPEIKYTKLNYVDIFVNGSKSIVVASYLYNRKETILKETGESCYYVSELKASAIKFNNIRTGEVKNCINGGALFVFNKVVNKVKFICPIFEDKLNYLTTSQTLNLDTFALSELITIRSEKLNAKNMIASPGKKYLGFPQHYHIDLKGNEIILSEYISYESGIALAAEIGISCMTSTGQDSYGEIVHYSHYQASKNRMFMYTKALNSYAFSGSYDEFYETYLGLVSAEFNSYLFLNNTVERFDMGDKAPTIWTGVTSNKPKFTSFIYTLNDAGIVSKEYIFEKPVSEDVTKYCRFNTADYDPATGLYAVIVIEKIKGKKTAGVVWMNLK